MSQANQRFKWITDDAFWDNGVASASPRPKTRHTLPVGPFMAQPDPHTNASFFCLTTTTQVLNADLQKMIAFQSTMGNPFVAPLVTIENSPCINFLPQLIPPPPSQAQNGRKLSAIFAGGVINTTVDVAVSALTAANVKQVEPPSRIVGFARNSPSTMKGTFPYAFDSRSGRLRPVGPGGDPVMDECFGYDQVSGQLRELGGSDCTSELSAWDVPCGLPGSFSHPPCDAFYRVHNSAYRRYVPKDHTFWVPCTGTPTINTYSESCTFCSEPWNLTQGAYLGTTMPMIVWPPDQAGFLAQFANASRMNVSYDFAQHRLMDAWYPPDSAGGMPNFHGFTTPVGHTAQGCTFAATPDGRTPIPRCGAIPESIGTGEWWQLPGRPTRTSDPRFGPCPGPWEAGLTSPAPPPLTPPPPKSPYPPYPPGAPGGVYSGCPMELVPVEGAALGYTCPSYACDDQPRALPTLGAGHGLVARASKVPGNTWWWDVLQSSDPNSYVAQLEAYALTVVNFGSNAAWYPLYAALGRTLSYDVALDFVGMLKPSTTCAYSFYLDTESKAAYVTLQDPTGVSAVLSGDGGQIVVDASNPASATGATAFERRSTATYTLQAGVHYAMFVHYEAPTSAGPDPVTGEAVLEPTDRQLVLSWSCPGSTILYKKTVIASQFLFHTANDTAFEYSFASQNPKDAPHYTLSLFGRGWDALSSSVLDWDVRVTWPLEAAANALGDAVAPIYAGLSEPLRLSVAWLAEIISALMKKAVYTVYAIGVTDQSGAHRHVQASSRCFAAMGQSARAYGDALVESLPMAVEFAMDLKEGLASEGYEPVCATYEHENFILAGSLKAYYFASESCNVRYTGGSAVRCTLEDGVSAASHCTGFQLPVSTFNTNFLCSIDRLLLTVVREVMFTVRILVDFAEAVIVDLITCLQTNQCSMSEFAGQVGASFGALLGDLMCALHGMSVQASGTLVSILSPMLQSIYEVSGHETVKEGLSLTGDSGYLMVAHHRCGEYEAPGGGCNVFGANDPRNALCVSSGARCVSTCTRHENSATCGTDGACAWINDRCYTKDDQWMTYQSYPLEASLITMLTSFLDIPYWAAYLGNGYLQMFAGIFGIQLSPKTEASPSAPYAATASLQAAANRASTLAGAANVDAAAAEAAAASAQERLAALNAQVAAMPATATADAVAGLSAQRVQAVTQAASASKAAADARTYANAMAASAEDAASKAASQGSRPPTKAASNAGIVGAQQKPRQSIILIIEVFTIAARDLVIGFYEVVRAVVYVSDPATMEGHDFYMFTHTLRTVVNMLEFFIATLGEAIMDLVGDAAKLMFDMEGLVSGRLSIQSALEDMLKILVNLMSQFEDMFKQLFLNMPGFKSICLDVIKPIGVAVNAVMGFVCQIVDLINSITDFLGMGGLPKPKCNMNVNFCSIFDNSKRTNEFEPSTCNNDGDCTTPDYGGTPVCWVDSANTQCRYSNYVGVKHQPEQRQQWDQPCLCDDFGPDAPPPFCNVATGFCQEGPSFFEDPLSTCPISGSLELIPQTAGDRWDHQHSLCYVLPAWRCSTLSRSLYSGGKAGWAPHHASQGEHLRALTQCRWDVANDPKLLQGPMLCSEFCSPTVLHDDNRLTQVTTARGSMCACEVGVHVGSDHLFAPRRGNWLPLTLADPSAYNWSDWTIAAAAMGLQPLKTISAGAALANTINAAGGRHLLSLEASTCKSDVDCMAAGSSCTSPWGAQTPCSACPDPVPGSNLTSACAPDSGSCFCSSAVRPHGSVVDQRLKKLDTVLFDPSAWGGDSSCDRLVRSFSGNTDSVTALERMHLEGCGAARLLSDKLASVTGVPLPGDLFYNWVRPLRLAAALASALPKALHNPAAIDRLASENALDARLLASAVHVAREVSKAAEKLSEHPFVEKLAGSKEDAARLRAAAQSVPHVVRKAASTYANAPQAAVHRRRSLLEMVSKKSTPADSSSESISSMLGTSTTSTEASAIINEIFSCRVLNKFTKDAVSAIKPTIEYYTHYFPSVSMGKFNAASDMTGKTKWAAPVSSVPPRPPPAPSPPPGTATPPAPGAPPQPPQPPRMPTPPKPPNPPSPSPPPPGTPPPPAAPPVPPAIVAVLSPVTLPSPSPPPYWQTQPGPPPPPQPPNVPPRPPLPPSPSPPPPPVPPPSPQPPQSPSFVPTNSTNAQKSVQHSVLGVGSAVCKAAGISSDLEKSISDAVNKFSVGNWQADILNVAVCNPQSMLCPVDAGGERLMARGFTTALWLYGAVCALNLVGGTAASYVSTLVSIVSGVLYVPIVMYRTYDLQPSCIWRLKGMVVPVCFVDDVYDIMDKYLLPRHIGWPAGLLHRTTAGAVRADTRQTLLFGAETFPITRLIGAPTDCVSLGFTDGVRVATYWLQKSYGNEWRPYVPLWTFGTIFSHSTVDWYTGVWVDLPPALLASDQYSACASLGIVHAPLAAALAMLGALAVVVVLQVMLVGTRSALRLVGAVTRG